MLHLDIEDIANKLRMSGYISKQLSSEVPSKIISHVKMYFNRITTFSASPLQTTWQALVAVLRVVAVYNLAIFVYAAFYYTYIPETILSRDIHFQRNQFFKERPTADGSTTKIMMTNLHAKIVSSDKNPIISPGETYSIELELDLPESEVNRNAGTFTISTAYYDKMDNLMTSSSRLIMLRYKSWLLRTMDTLVYAPLYLIGFYDQKQIRIIPMFAGYKENAYRPTTLITVDIDNPDLQIYSAAFTVRAQLGGLRYYMHQWPIVAGIICSNFLFVFLSAIIYASWHALSSDSDTVHIHDQKKLKNGIANSPASKGSELEQSMPEGELAPNEPDTSLRPPERATIDVDNHREVTSLGVTPLDSSDMTVGEPTIRRRNHTAEQSST